MINKIITFIFVLIFISTFNSLHPKTKSNLTSLFSYISPVPNSELNLPGTNILLKAFDESTVNSLEEKNIIVTGSLSGYHIGKIHKTDDSRIIVFKPLNEFSNGENVYVRIKEIKSQNNIVKSFSFNFKIAKQQVKVNFSNSFQREYKENGIYYNQTQNLNKKINVNNIDSIPSDFPPISIVQYNNPTPGKIFLSNFSIDTSNHESGYLIIVDNYGNPIRYKRMHAQGFDFKPQYNNMYTYFDDATDQYYAIDTSFNLIDSFSCGNGYVTDLHELRVLPNWHAFLMAYDSEVVDMSQIVPGGNPHAVVAGLIVQELDQDKNVIWQWRSWDHYKITDATHENLTGSNIDYVHGNAIEILNDGNILISCRHMDEITKINHENGSIIWRLGGKNNQFTFINDSIGFSHQHAIRFLQNGNLTIFDNGNFHSPPFSRAVEYSMDENSKTVTKVWEFRHNPPIFGPAMGYVERLSNGNSLIGWGFTNPSVTEVTPGGQIVLELSFPQAVFSYRAFKLENNQLPQISLYPANYVLAQNYPNPFNPSTRIDYFLPVTANVRLSVYDILGRLVTTLVNAKQNAGRHFVNLDGKNLSNGVYFYTLIANNFRETKKLVIVK
jgi:hypothetical protein